LRRIFHQSFLSLLFFFLTSMNPPALNVLLFQLIVVYLRKNPASMQKMFSGDRFQAAVNVLE